MSLVREIRALFHRGKYRRYTRAELIEELEYYHGYAKAQQADSAHWQDKYFALRAKQDA